MKKLLCTMSILLILQACSHRGHLSKTAVVIAHDYTDDNRLIPDANSVLDLYSYNSKTLCYAGYFKQISITDFANNREIEFSIPNAEEGEKENLLDDPLFRKKEVLAFRDSVFHAINQTAYRDTYIKPESRIYETMCKELRALVKMDAERKFFILSSDLVENSELLDAYKESFLRIIATDREKAKTTIKEKFEDAFDMPDNLGHVIIYVIFQPKTKADDVRFSFFRELYREMLEQRGATVHFKSVNIIKECNHV